MALFCTDTFVDEYGDRIVEIAPDLDVVALDRDEEVADEDIARITIAFFSNDAWPERAAPFFKVALDAPNLQWLHSMSAGVDSPVFATFLDRGARLTTSSGASAPPIAGTVMLYLLALSRNLPGWLRAQAAHEWRPRRSAISRANASSSSDTARSARRSSGWRRRSGWIPSSCGARRSATRPAPCGRSPNSPTRCAMPMPSSWRCRSLPRPGESRCRRHRRDAVARRVRQRRTR